MFFLKKGVTHALKMEGAGNIQKLFMYLLQLFSTKIGMMMSLPVILFEKKREN